ncbi:MAG: hypothetical protein WKG06_07970 [Segetibacter sp.]
MYKQDSSDVVVRSFNNNELQEFKKDKDFQYIQSDRTAEKFMGKILELDLVAGS